MLPNCILKPRIIACIGTINHIFIKWFGICARATTRPTQRWSRPALLRLRLLNANKTIDFCYDNSGWLKPALLLRKLKVLENSVFVTTAEGAGDNRFCHNTWRWLWQLLLPRHLKVVEHVETIAFITTTEGGFWQSLWKTNAGGWDNRICHDNLRW